MMGSIHIGTSGWHYGHWRGPFYPENLPDEELLPYYAEYLDTVEINNSFYQLPSSSTLEAWQQVAPQHFRFAMKASRYITHMKKLKDPRESSEQFFEAAEILDAQLGPILFQLPPNWSVNTERLEQFVDALPPTHCHVMEFRDESWMVAETKEILEEHSVAFCIYHISHYHSPVWVTSDFAYVRLHGPEKEAYKGSYTRETLQEWAELFRSWSEDGTDIYCYFDNDEAGYAPQNAMMLKEMLS